MVTLTKEQVKTRYNISATSLRNLAEEIGAIVYNGNRVLYHRKKLDDYLSDRFLNDIEMRLGVR